jgi:plastocyanin
VSKKYLAAAATAITLVVAGAPFAATRSSGPVVKTPGMSVFVANQYVKDTMHFAPATIHVRSGDTVTFENTTKDEPHTVTISTKADLPKSNDGPCKPCRIASAHLKDPNNPDKGVKTYVLNKGRPGFDVEGDSIVIAPKGPHKFAKVVISAPAGTTLYYVCAVHPWMQGEIVVS